MASVTFYRYTGTNHVRPDEYLNAPIWVSAQTGRWFTSVHKAIGKFGVLAEDTVDQRPYGDLKAEKPGHVPTLLGAAMASKIPGAEHMSDAVLAKLVDQRNEAWMAKLAEETAKSRQRREGVKVGNKPIQPSQRVKPKSVTEMVAEIIAAEG